MIEYETPEQKMAAFGAIRKVFLPQVIPGGRIDGWVPPVAIVSTLPKVERFKADLLPKPLRYIFDIAERQQSPADFAAVAALCGLASIIGNRVRIAPKQHDDWLIVPNLWGGIVGRPSAMKTPAMQAALAPLYAIQDGLRDGWEKDTKDQQIEETISKMAAKKTLKDAAKLASQDRNAARALIEAADGTGGDHTPCPRRIVNDASVEKLGELLNENPRGLLLIRDELPGFLAKMNAEEFASERAFYLEAFNGDGRFTYDRIGRGTVHIANCTVSMIGGLQPSKLIPIVRGAISGASNDGLIQRLQMMVWPDDRPDWKWVDRHPNLSEREAFEAVFRNMEGNLPGTPDEPTIMRFSPDAQILFQKWMAALQREARAGEMSSVMESHVLKMPKTIASLALIFELVDGGLFEVGTDAMQRALAWASYLRSHANRIYACGQNGVEDAARLMIERKDKLSDGFTARDVRKKDWSGLTDVEGVAEAIETLISTHHLREAAPVTNEAGGRPTVAYQWNPMIEAEA